MCANNIILYYNIKCYFVDYTYIGTTGGDRPYIIFYYKSANEYNIVIIRQLNVRGLHTTDVYYNIILYLYNDITRVTV